jgi:glutathione S-transferase
MKLYWSTRSPYARKVMIAAHELGVADRITCVPVVVTAETVSADYARVNPTGQLPTLLLEDGTTVLDSLIICEYLDASFGAHILLLPHGTRRFEVLRRHELGDGLMDRALRWLGENFRPAALKSEDVVAACRSAIESTLDALEREAAGWPAGRFDLGDIAIACALSYLDFRFAILSWRTGRPTLAKIYDSWAARPAMHDTEFAK